MTTDRVLTVLNLALLLCIAFMPYPISILGLYGNTAVAVLFYTLTLALAGTVCLVMWLYAAINHRLIDPESQLPGHRASSLEDRDRDRAGRIPALHTGGLVEPYCGGSVLASIMVIMFVLRGVFRDAL